MSLIDALFTPYLILDHTCLVVGHFGVTLAAWGWWIDLGKQKARCSRPDPYDALIQTVANVACKHRVLGVACQQIQKNGKIDCFCNVLITYLLLANTSRDYATLSLEALPYGDSYIEPLLVTRPIDQSHTQDLTSDP